MAKIKIDECGAAIIMHNGAVVPVPPNYKSMEIYKDATLDVIYYPGDAELWVANYRAADIIGLVGGLADGRTFRGEEGATWTRYGDEMLIKTPEYLWTPPEPKTAAQRRRLARRSALLSMQVADESGGAVGSRRAA